MKESVLKAFWRDTYQGRSPIPFIISVQVLLFVLIHLFDLFKEVGLLQISVYDLAVDHLSLPLSFNRFLQQPWSIITYPFLYTGLFELIFDCLWLYWMGSMFLTFLNKRQFLFVFISSLMLGGAVYVGLGFISALQRSVQVSMHTSTFAIGALVAAVATLVPRSEVRLFLFGNVQLKTIAIIYVALELIFISLVNKAGGVSFLVMVFWGILFTQALRNGKDLSLFWKVQKRSRLKVVHKNKIQTTAYPYRHQSDLPNQEEIDEILDKISVGGYESLTSQEKEVLFKASKGDRQS
ncbi:rhomboid family intramembrane serine protease [Sphingobacterium suaedae]|uniref:Rhomboid family intramembrane serine protease n=1 Tax=Sphingobacterium suaedae TaxID=1686402 RepID=A0ABW5KM04_9SPHI